ncbi:MAG: D-alanyl-D-alanine carboxypeptidase [Oscillospiraceae bacterium]|nr:D-alanyl-D-alanine carboxypeptidase [Oscillospiraceae bacterium]
MAALVLFISAYAEGTGTKGDGAAPSGIDNAVDSVSLEVAAPSAILVEEETGTVIYEKNADEQLEPASVTKVMTILLIIEAVESGALSLDDTVTASDRASAMGGSQVYLKQGEQMPVWEMLKCIVVSSANDAAVAMAEHIAGSEEAFVRRMNARAKELGMDNTNFINCTGLTNSPEHHTTARDISIMSRQVLSHEWIRDYTTIWMDSIREGEFGLTNTNKLIHYYEGATGLKTGYTSSAGHCLAASAERDGVEYIAVVLGCPSSAERFESARAMLNFAFANYTLVDLKPDGVLKPVRVKLGEQDMIQPVLKGQERVLVDRQMASDIEKRLEVEPMVEAPVEPGQVLGQLVLYSGDNTVAQAQLVAENGVERLNAMSIFKRELNRLLQGDK